MLDPIDGTKGFVAQRQYAIALALLVDGEVVMGVVGCPNLARQGAEVCLPGEGVLFLALRGHGSFEIPLMALTGANEAEVPDTFGFLAGTPGAARRLRQPETPLPTSALRVAESAADSVCSAYADTAAVAQELGIAEGSSLRSDSCAKYGICARGDAGLYLRFPPDGYFEKSWDHAAGAIVYEESGGVVSDCAGAPLDFSAGRALHIAGGIVASPSREAHKALLAAIQKRVTRKSAPPVASL